MLICRVCQELKEDSEYKISNKRLGTHIHTCKNCMKSKAKLFRQTHKEKIRDYQLKYYHEHRELLSRNRSEYSKNHPEKFRARSMKRHFNISLEEYSELFNLQQGLCSICGRPESTRTSTGNLKNLAVDHDHISGKVRGLLCHNCNLALGMFEDNPNFLISALEYLKLSPEFNVSGVLACYNSVTKDLPEESRFEEVEDGEVAEG
jgi:hypothetical protein